MNIPAVAGIFKALYSPHICLPHQTISHLSQLQIPVSKAFSHYPHPSSGEKVRDVDIRAVVLDKDNCFAVAGTNEIDPSCKDAISALKSTYSSSSLLIVSNSSGFAARDPDGSAAAALTQTTGIPVLLHNSPKPSLACGKEILEHFRSKGVDVRPEHICVIGDRLFTDTVLANGLGCWSIWVKEGVRKDFGLVTRAEYGVERLLRSRGFIAKMPGTI